ncbi:hypothetical protein C5167_034511 [Papaver somniferum]|uniref:Solute carrier family 40 member n=1 Tax=Papaver somniferum TaxID=3469 RepID=A0A4Y7KCY8_PAPSO|nr:hypothetical protein C5167_034511 [Papaver somniferum]
MIERLLFLLPPPPPPGYFIPAPTSYSHVLRLWLLTQNLSFIVAGVTVTWLLVHSGLRLSGFALLISLVVLTNVSGAIGTLSTLAGTILVEREWVIVIANGEPP